MAAFQHVWSASLHLGHVVSPLQTLEEVPHLQATEMDIRHYNNVNKCIALKLSAGIQFSTVMNTDIEAH